MSDRALTNLSSLPKAALLALPLLIAPAALTIVPHAIAVAQTGGGGGASGGGGAGTGGAAGTGASPGGTGAGSVAPGARPGSGTARGAGQTARPGAPSALPRTGIRPVPSPGNAEPSSPIHRQNEIGAGRDPESGGRTPRREAIDPGSRDPQTSPLPSGSGGTARTDGVLGARPLDPAPSSDGASDGTVGTEPVEERKSGAGGPTLSECMDAWDAGTNMTRQDWRETCQRLGR